MKTNLAVLFIIFLAIFLRFNDLSYMEFKKDEAVNCSLATDFVSKGIFPLVGDEASIGSYNAPAFIYLLSVPFLFSRDPLFAAGYIALLNILAIYLCFLFCKDFFNKRVALVAMALFAINPWVIFYSRKLWSSNALPLFILAFFYSLYKVILKREHKYILLCFASLAICTQLQPISVSCAVILFLALMFFRPQVKPLYYLIGSSIFLLLYIPYILYDIKNNFYNLSVYLKLSGLPFKLEPSAFVIPFKLATTSEFIKLLNWPTLDVFQFLLLFCSIVYLAYNFKERRYCILLLWFFVPVLFLLIDKVSLPRHYFISLYPAQFILIAILIDALIKKWGKRYRLDLLLPTLVSLIMCYNFISFFNFNSYIKSGRDLYWLGYGPPFKHRVEEIKSLVDKGEVDLESIHNAVSRDSKRFKCDFMATKYIVENLDYISYEKD